VLDDRPGVDAGSLRLDTAYHDAVYLVEYHSNIIIIIVVVIIRTTVVAKKVVITDLQSQNTKKTFEINSSVKPSEHNSDKTKIKQFFVSS